MNYYINEADTDMICSEVLKYIEHKGNSDFTDMAKDIIENYVKYGNPLTEKQQGVIGRLYFVYVYNWSKKSTPKYSFKKGRDD